MFRRSHAAVLGFSLQEDLKDQQNPPTSDLPSEPTTTAAFQFQSPPSSVSQNAIQHVDAAAG